MASVELDGNNHLPNSQPTEEDKDEPAVVEEEAALTDGSELDFGMILWC